jgi:hypothetical protein
MFRRSTWVLLIIFILIFTLTVFVEKNPTLTAGLRTPTATAYPKLLGELLAENIQSIEITPATGKPFSVKRNNDQSWSIPNESQPVDNGKVEQLLTSLADLKIYTILDSSMSKDAIGLTKSPLTIAYDKSDGSTKTIKIGQVTPTQSGYYVQVDNDSPIVIDKSALDPIIDLLRVDNLLVPQPTANPLAPPSVDLATSTP